MGTLDMGVGVKNEEYLIPISIRLVRLSRQNACKKNLPRITRMSTNKYGFGTIKKEQKPSVTFSEGWNAF
ncbi:MAG: hypothetical protein LBI03_06700 [Clostridiales bacterium]|jgi:hypothetical protein|nr:hypothetical protein [Clostridiales bacterium]